jgi:miniconductance mechanosensitive channel
METSALQNWVDQNPLAAIGTLVLIGLLLLLFARNVVARGLIYISSRTQTRVDDILVRHLRPRRISWLAPLGVYYAFAYLLPDYQEGIRKGALFGILMVSVLSVNALLSALNEIYESRPGFTGVSIQSYLDIIKILIVLVGVILSVSLFSGESPWVLLTGLGALTAVLLLIFQDTLLSIVASVQIAAHDLIKEGDWIEVPSYGADGDVVNISLHTIKVQNFDKTFTMIPTYKIVDVAYKNWRGMQESGGRRIQRSILVDMTSIKFCDDEMLSRLSQIDLIQDYLEKRLQAIRIFKNNQLSEVDSPLDGPQITNVEIFRSYIRSYLRQRPDIHRDGMPFLIRALAPNPTGLPIEIYVFTRTTSWETYEAIQSDIFDHLLAAASHFDLRVFQEPTGLDFSAFSSALAAGVKKTAVGS